MPIPKIAPYYQKEGITIYHGEAEKVLPRLEGRFDARITDPPFCVGYKYNTHKDKPSDYCCD